MKKEMKTVQVKAASGYPVWIGGGLLEEAGERIKEIKTPCRAVIVADQTTADLFGATINRSLIASGFIPSLISIEPGEGSKSMETLGRILEFMADCHLDRSDVLLALGGGVVGDLAGFAAAVYLRGMDYVQIPTTFLAAIDSSVGGKTAVNLTAGKNLAGAFHQPLAVICDCHTLQSLSGEVFADGAAEAVKYGVLAGEELFALLLAGKKGKAGLPPERLPGVVEQCVRMKAGIVERDEFDRGERQLLNLGHTIGHSVETCSGFTVTHGRAVAIGMAIVARGAESRGFAEAGCAERICRALKVQGLPTETEISSQALYEGALTDKKRRGESIQLILPQKIGVCEIQKTSMAELRQLIDLGRER